MGFPYALLLDPPMLEDFQWYFNGLTLGADTPYGVLNVEGIDLAAIRHGDEPWPRDHGEAMGLDLYEGRDIIMDLWMKSDGTSLQHAQAALAKASKVLPSSELPLWFQLPNLPILCVVCRPRKKPMKIDANYAAAEIGEPEWSLHATDPRIYGEAKQTELTQAEKEKTLANGDCEMRPILVFNGPLTQPWVRNKTITGGPRIRLRNPAAEPNLSFISLLDALAEPEGTYYESGSWRKLSWTTKPLEPRTQHELVLGKETVLANTEEVPNEHYRGVKATAAHNGLIEQLSFYLHSAESGLDYIVEVYRDNGGTPGQRLTHKEGKTSEAITEKYVTVELTSAEMLQVKEGEVYWLVVYFYGAKKPVVAVETGGEGGISGKPNPMKVEETEWTAATPMSMYATGASAAVSAGSYWYAKEYTRPCAMSVAWEEGTEVLAMWFCLDEATHSGYRVMVSKRTETLQFYKVAAGTPTLLGEVPVKPENDDVYSVAGTAEGELFVYRQAKGTGAVRRLLEVEDSTYTKGFVALETEGGAKLKDLEAGETTKAIEPYTVATGDQLLVDLGTPHRVRYYVGGLEAEEGSNVRNWITLDSTWWDLVEEDNDLEFGSSDSEAAGTVDVRWAPASQL